MNYVLDTHILIWRYLDPKKLSRLVQKLFLNDENVFLVPTVSLLEVSYLIEIGRIELDFDHLRKILYMESIFELVPFDEATLAHSVKLTRTRDPFDRMILGLALSRATKIITKDRWMQKTAPKLVVF